MVQVVAFPAGWWHAVVNLTPTVAVTESFGRPCDLELITTKLREKGLDSFADEVEAGQRGGSAGTSAGGVRSPPTAITSAAVTATATTTAATEQQQQLPPSPHQERPARLAASGPGWQEVFVSPTQACSTANTADAVSQGLSVVLLHGLATADECETLRVEASATAHAARERVEEGSTLETIAEVPPSQLESAAGQVRMPIATMLGTASQQVIRS